MIGETMNPLIAHFFIYIVIQHGQPRIQICRLLTTPIVWG